MVATAKLPSDAFFTSVDHERVLRTDLARAAEPKYQVRMACTALDDSFLDMRAAAIVWYDATAKYFQLSPRTVPLAVNFLDRFSSIDSLCRSNHDRTRLAAITCLVIASKLEDGKLTLNRMQQLSMSAWETSHGQHEEQRILHALKYKIAPTLAMDILDDLCATALVRWEHANESLATDCVAPTAPAADAAAVESCALSVAVRSARAQPERRLRIAAAAAGADAAGGAAAAAMADTKAKLRDAAVMGAAALITAARRARLPDIGALERHVRACCEMPPAAWSMVERCCALLQQLLAPPQRSSGGGGGAGGSSSGSSSAAAAAAEASAAAVEGTPVKPKRVRAKSPTTVADVDEVQVRALPGTPADTTATEWRPATGAHAKRARAG
ncbi:hypothetical protein JKP88DRAFT_273376 [Tribonema minus]|uniref:Cyclin N-terminal domain-containing protein n=1 Tax=Tribonema minus TaxID=303371 RepID=A0A835Z2Y4_9STRA|nr:hypothetical protein JKP88DRAFT_273376 [Tribonema minus]